MVTMNEKLLSAARIAELAGVSRQIVTRLFNENCPDAKVGTKWDVYNPYIFEYLKERGVDVVGAKLQSAKERRDPQATKPVSQSREKLSGRSGAIKPDGDQYGGAKLDHADISDYPEMTLREISHLHGTEEEFRGWADAYKKVQDGIEKEIKNKKLKGEVIERDFVITHVFGFMQEMASRMLVDYPRKLVEMAYAHCESGDPKEEAEASIREELGKPIQAAKAQIIKNIGEPDE
jgi:hypothetical protein